MKALYISFFLLGSFMRMNGQQSVIGIFKDHFNHQLELKPDNSFNFDYFSDTLHSWTGGKWKMAGDSVFLLMIPLYDTIHFVWDNGMELDQVYLSPDSKPERLTEGEWVKQQERSGQNKIPFPDSLVFRKGVLYEIRDGLILEGKAKRLDGKKKYRLGYFREKN